MRSKPDRRSRVLDVADDRLGVAEPTRAAATKVFPDHWSFLFGEIALYSFVALILTGVYLTLFFEPSTAERVYDGSYAPLHGRSVSAAYGSTVTLSFDVRAGLMIRQAHHWAALIFLAAIVLHLCRIFFTAAFRRPREVNWLVGLTMLLLGLANGFAGYSLPDDLLSGMGLRIASAVVLSIPVVGTWLQFALFGGEFPGEIIPRLYIVHVLIVPALLAGLITAHMAVLVLQKHTQFAGPGRRESNVLGAKMWPTYAFRSLALLSAVLAVVFALGGLAQINPVWLWGPFEPADATSPAQPDWYIGWLEGSLRLFPPWEFHVFGYLVPSVFWPAVVLPGLTFTLLYVWPWLDRRITRDHAAHHLLQRPRDCPLRTAVGAAGLTFYTVLLLAGGSDVVARLWDVPVTTVVRTLQVVVLIAPVVVGTGTYLVARALRDSGAEGLGGLRWQDLRPSTRDAA